MARHIRYQVFRVPVVLLISFYPLVCASDAIAQSSLPPAVEPWLAEPGDWAADFNAAQVACFQGSMTACDAIWLNDRVLIDSWLGQYGRTCGGRVELRTIRRANVNCVEAFPGNE